ncbi:hypothetical protein [Longimicrobium terrae]|uniref:Cell shape-determining protein MreD n=1 Tax=Longimicrobium terrae TaxID=1639882 RepID=A0A841GVV0_9BACT|nr:hypothetical protein [Longimicrobium terrae]MBB4635301.1 cell shape-determining protein MreD [Longimicrobium terrae]MBB6069694.1 cell shape-determining protein MreD [Longimicrobium terrae]NNC31095.1 hypothetical protein [Longimicrobium terrae]
MTEGTRWQFVAFIAVLAVLYFLLRIGMGLGEFAPDLLVVALLLAARRMRAGWAAGLGVLLGLLDGSVNMYTFGAGALALAVLGYLGARSREWIAGDSPVVLVIYLIAGKWLYDAMMYLLLLRTDVAGPVSGLAFSLIAAIYAGAVGLAAAAAYRAVA